MVFDNSRNLDNRAEPNGNHSHTVFRGILLPFLIFISFCTWPVWSVPKVAVSIAPLHSLVSGVMQGVGTPELLLPGGQSPHTWAISPSKVKSVHSADLVIWIGPDYEIPLRNTIEQINFPERVMPLQGSTGLTTLPVREGGLWESHAAHDENPGESLPHGKIDPHLWLSFYNAQEMVLLFSDRLSLADGENREVYRRNADQMIDRMQRLNTVLAENLAETGAKPYVVFHDAYQYFEKEFGLNPIGSITLNPERPAGAKRIRNLRKAIIHNNVSCIFSEPQFQSRLIPTIMENTGARSAILDPLGVDLQPGPNLWFELMTRLAQSLKICLSQAPS